MGEEGRGNERWRWQKEEKKEKGERRKEKGEKRKEKGERRKTRRDTVAAKRTKGTKQTKGTKGIRRANERGEGDGGKDCEAELREKG